VLIVLERAKSSIYRTEIFWNFFFGGGIFAFSKPKFPVALPSIGPKSLYSATPLLFNSPDDGEVFPGTISVKLYLDVNRWPRYAMA